MPFAACSDSSGGSPGSTVSLGVPGASACSGCSTCVRCSTKHSQKPDGAKTHRGTVFINLIYQYIEIFLNNLIS